MLVRIGIMTDGEWVWELAWADYVAYHRVAPPTEFMEHVRSVNFSSPEIPEDELMQIIKRLGMPMP